MRAHPRRPRAGSVALFLALFLLFLPGLGAAQPLPPPRVALQEKTLELFLVATAQGAALDPNPNATTLPEYVAEPDVTAGGRNQLNHVATGATPVPFVFQTRTPLPQTYWLNLSKPYYQYTKPMSGTLHWRSQTADLGEQYLLHIEVFLDDVRVGGMRVEEEGSGSPINDSLYFHPEVTKLDRGKTLSLRVTFIAGHADFIVGTQAPAQTFLRFYYFDQDPLGGSALLEAGGKLSLGPPPEEGATQQATPPGPTPPALLVIPFFALLALPLRGRGRLAALVVVAALLSVAFAGCLDRAGSPAHLGSNPLPSTSAGPPPDVKFRFDETLHKQRMGVVVGAVRDAALNLPISGATVFLYGTNSEAGAPSTTTNENGAYSFPHQAQAGRVDLYFAHVDFNDTEAAAEVKLGYYTYVNVTMVSPQITSDETIHTHNPWGSRTMLSVTDEPVTFHVDGTAALADGQWYCDAVGPPQQVKDEMCETTLPFPVGKTIPPGSSRITLTLQWDAKAPGAPQEFALTVWTALGNTYTFMPRGPGDPFGLAFFPHEADPAHQTFTDWKFSVWLPRVKNYAPKAPVAYLGGPGTFEIAAYKGTLVHEPKHPDLWHGQTRLTIVDNVAEKPSSLSPYSDYPKSKGCGGCWEPAAGKLVPPGAKEIQGLLRWRYDHDAPGSEWTLLFRPANVPPYVRDTTLLRAVEVVDTGPNYVRFKIPLTGTDPITGEARQEWTDQVYQRKSNWGFHVDDGSDLIPGTDVNPTHPVAVTWALAAYVIRDTPGTDPADAANPAQEVKNCPAAC